MLFGRQLQVDSLSITTSRTAQTDFYPHLFDRELVNGLERVGRILRAVDLLLLPLL
jgi:hypothetical protein